MRDRGMHLRGRASVMARILDRAASDRVTPAKAGVHTRSTGHAAFAWLDSRYSGNSRHGWHLDSRVRGNDGCFGTPWCPAGHGYFCGNDKGHGQAIPRRNEYALGSLASHLMLLALLAGLLAGLLFAPAAQAQTEAPAAATGALQGQVVNGTAGGAEIGEGIPVTLYLVSGAEQEQIQSAVTDAEGRFAFEGLDASAMLQYWVEALYAGVSYGSAELLQFAGGQAALETTVTVYETTEDDAGVQLDLVHIFAESFGQVLRISETHLFGSSADRAYIGQEGDEGRRLTVLAPVPGDVVGFAVGEGIAEDRFTTVKEGVVDSEPVRPGNLTSEVRFSYHLMVTSNPITVERAFAYPVADLTVLVAQPGLTLTSQQLVSMGVQTIQDRQYDILTGQVPEPQTPVVLTFTATGEAEAAMGIEAMPGTEATSGGAAGGNQGVLLWLGVAVAVLAVFAAVFFAVSRRPAGVRIPDPGAAYDPGARELIARLADLEDAFEAGELDETAYVRQRMEIFKELG
jgi:hypothetical protein